jgi:hypothetical protein
VVWGKTKERETEKKRGRNKMAKKEEHKYERSVLLEDTKKGFISAWFFGCVKQ